MSSSAAIQAEAGADVPGITAPALVAAGAYQTFDKRHGLAPALEERLIGLADGAHAGFDLPADAAFGPRNADLVQRLPRAVFEAESERTDYSPGDVVEFNAPGGGRYAGVFRALEAEYAVFDFNHPLAGQPVRFDVQIVGIL